MDNTIITRREREVINKKFNNHRLSQLDSNVLTRSLRPKLRQILEINAGNLLKRLDYNVKSIAIEKKIKKIVLENLTNVEAIIVFGSAIQTNYKEYNDLDIIIVTKSRLWKKEIERNEIIDNIEEIGEKEGIKLDVQIISKKALIELYPSNPSLIYQLKDCKVIYGKIKIPDKISLPKLDLRMKLDWSDIDDEESDGKEIYQSLRNIVLVKLLMDKKVDNELLAKNTASELGNEIIARLKTNIASRLEKRLVLKYIKELSERTDKEIKEAKWEKIVL